jgi:hypothetical protein
VSWSTMPIFARSSRRGTVAMSTLLIEIVPLSSS